MPRRRSADVPRARSGVYLRRAEELLKAADWGLEQRLANVGAVNAVQAGISATDAFLVHHLGQRSTGADHHEAMGLLAMVTGAGVREIGQHLQRILDRKSEVEYQDREVTLNDAKELTKHARRLLVRVQSELRS
ncbi:MAG TPA: HEPN domain-containing protein [Thermoplasmata archaeon]